MKSRAAGMLPVEKKQLRYFGFLVNRSFIRVFDYITQTQVKTERTEGVQSLGKTEHDQPNNPIRCVIEIVLSKHNINPGTVG